MLEKKVKEYGVTKLAYELGLCELSIRNKITGKAKITPSEMIAIQKLLSLSDKEISIIKEELNNGAQSNNSSSDI